jgi:alkylation response protein AidB-like acyl-CoA dehydrogenase
MNFDYNEEQQLLADSLRRYLQAQYSFEQRKKVLDGSPEIWGKFAEMGLMALPLSPDHGGFGGGAVDLMAIMEAFGAALVVEPYLATLVASRLVARAGSAEQKTRSLPASGRGRMKLAFAHTESGAPRPRRG